MKKPYKSKDSCRLCNSKDLELVVPLGYSPISEKYLTRENLNEQQIKVSLDLYFCNRCTHVQLLDVVDPSFLWSDYTFRTADNPILVKHFKDIAERILTFNPMDKNDLIVDIGSNDGTLLKCFKDVGYGNVLGIDPALEISAEATKRGIPTIQSFMDEHTANQVLKKHGKGF